MRPLIHRGFFGLFDPPTRGCGANLEQNIVDDALNYTLKQNLHFINKLFMWKSHSPNQSLCDRISMEAVRELKLKEESNHATSHIN
jgi:hypothetical protein